MCVSAQDSALQRKCGIGIIWLMKPLPNSIPKLKVIADKYFSLYVRTYYSKDGICECYTCYRKFPIKELDNGHYVSRTCGALRYSLINCRPQCYYCNRFCEGKKDEFTMRLEAENPGILKELNRIKYLPFSFGVQDLKEKIDLYKTELKGLKNI